MSEQRSLDTSSALLQAATQSAEDESEVFLLICSKKICILFVYICFIYARDIFSMQYYAAFVFFASDSHLARYTGLNL